MTAHEIIDVLIAILIAMVGFISKRMMEKFDDLEKTMLSFKETVQNDFVKRDEYEADLKDIKGMLGNIFRRLDKQADTAAVVARRTRKA